MNPEILSAQIQSIIEDYEINAVNISMIGRNSTLQAFIPFLEQVQMESIPIVFDPVMITKT